MRRPRVQAFSPVRLSGFALISAIMCVREGRLQRGTDPGVAPSSRAVDLNLPWSPLTTTS